MRPPAPRIHEAVQGTPLTAGDWTLRPEATLSGRALSLPSFGLWFLRLSPDRMVVERDGTSTLLDLESPPSGLGGIKAAGAALPLLCGLVIWAARRRD